MGEVSGVATAECVEVPIHLPACPVVTTYLDIWVLGESTGP